MTSPPKQDDKNNNDVRASLTRRVTQKLQSRAAEQLQRQSSGALAVAGPHVAELEYEEWDATNTPFWQHCLAGSVAGVVEHLLMYPVDTLKTHVQTAGTAEETGMIRLLKRHLQSSADMVKLWRGAQAMAMGCIPAHAAQFSSYEAVKTAFLVEHNNSSTLGPLGSTVAGATAALSHDLIMVPADTIKQRLQLGYYAGLADALRNILRTEGPVALYRALPVTLCTNLPYGAIMVTTNEALRAFLLARQTRLHDDDDDTPVLTVQTTLLAGSGAGMMAAAVTAPLDRLKTKLQTQGLGVVIANATSTTTTTKSSAQQPLSTTVKYKGLTQAFQSVLQTEGFRGLFRGAIPRVVTHTPSVAISWTVYEFVKGWLADL